MSQSHDHLRVGDRERAAAAERLSAHAAAGRLSIEELEERLAAANAAVHGRDLAVLEADLPGPPAPAPPRRPPPRRSGPPPLWPVLPIALVALAIAASVAVGHPVGFPLLLLFVVWRFAGRAAAP